MRAGEAAPVAFFVILRELGPRLKPPLDYGTGVGGLGSPSAVAIAV